MDFIYPVKNHRLTSKYGMRLHPVLNVRRLHAGIDLVGGGKVPIYAAAAGTVRLVKTTKDGYGKYVIITHNINGKTYQTNYAHLDSYIVKAGQKVLQGQQIGIMGNTGIGTGVHLHFEIHEGKYLYAGGTYPNSRDPLLYLEKQEDKEDMAKIEALEKEVAELKKQLASKASIEDHTQSENKEMKEALGWAFQHGILQGNGNGLNANGALTREQMATMLYRYHKLQNK